MVEKSKTDMPSPFQRVLPGLGIGKDHLMMRLDFYGEAIVLQDFDKNGGRFRMVSAHDLANAMANQLSFSSGILPENALWWANTRGGPVVALWVEPGIRKLALQTSVQGPPERYDVPLPGLIFVCRPGRSPAVYAAAKRPAGPKEKIYKSPVANVYDDGRSCGGSHRYSENVGQIPGEFFKSFFTRDATLDGRSKRYPDDITLMWKELHKKKAQEYPLNDLVYHGIAADLMSTRCD
ncbi:MAG: hypothetical protein WC541_10690 [Dehalococcoidia bacterium]